MVNLEQAYAAILDVEAHFDVGELVLDGVPVWMAVRDVFTRPTVIHRQETYRELMHAGSHTDPLAWRALDLDRLDLNAVGDTFDHQDVGDAVLFNRHGADYREERTDVLVYTSFTDYSEFIDGRVYNRVNDGFLDLVPDGLQGRALMKANPTAPVMPFWNPPHFYVERGGSRVRSPLVEGEESFSARMVEIIAFSRQRGHVVFDHPRSTLDRLRTMLWRSRMTQQMLRVLAPRAVFMTSFGNIERLGITLACWREGIPSCDIEHGFMGPHSVFGQLGFIGDGGQNPLIPRFYWTWGRESADFMRASLPTTPHHEVVVGGNTWLRARRDLVDAGLLGTDDVDHQLPVDYVRRVRAAKRVVLFCWQPDQLVHNEVPELVPGHLLDALDRIGDEVLFLLRLHPRSHHLIPDSLRLLADAGIQNFEIEHSTREPLADLLPLADVVATSYSTVAFEANELSIPVAIIDAFGASMMRDYLDRGVFLDASTVDGAMAAFLTSSRSDTEVVPYVDMSADAPTRAINTVLAAEVVPFEDGRG